MKITPEVLKALKGVYDLETAITESHCSRQEKDEICHYILGDIDLLQTFIPQAAALFRFVRLFSDINTTVGMEEAIFMTLLANKQSIHTFFSNGYFIACLFDIFINKHLSAENRKRRCLAILNQIPESSSFSEIKISSKPFLISLIDRNPDLQEPIMAWAETMLLIKSDQSKSEIMELVDKRQKEKAEQAKKTDLAVPSTKVNVAPQAVSSHSATLYPRRTAIPSPTPRQSLLTANLRRD